MHNPLVELLAFFFAFARLALPILTLLAALISFSAWHPSS
jgi:hypothetical protein